MRTIPNSVQDGMTVYDRGMNAIGVIETFRVGDDDPALPGAEAAGVSPILEQDQNSLTSILADIFSPDDGLPREIQEKALREGFIRLDADGLFARDRYIFPEQIDRVTAEGVVLNVEKSDLLHA